MDYKATDCDEIALCEPVFSTALFGVAAFINQPIKPLVTHSMC